MSIDDLYGERSWIRGKIRACENKISELEKIIKRTKKEIEDLKEDKEKINNIVNYINSSGSIISCLDNAISNTNSAKDSVASYYNGYQTSGWKSSFNNVAVMTGETKKAFSDIVAYGKSVIAEIDAEIKKKDNYLQETRDKLESTEDDLEGYESDLDDVQWEIDHYYDDEDD